MAHTDVVEETIDRIISTVGELPAAPVIVTAAMRLTNDLQSNVTEIARVLSADQSLTAKVLKLANSPYYGRSSSVKTLHEAVMVLGFREVRSLVIATSAHEMYTSERDNVSATKLWRHSLSSAIAARQIAKHIVYPAPDEAYVAALLHDVGKLVMLQQVPEWYLKIISEVEKRGCSFRSIEKRILRFDHCDIASVLLGEWSFPDEIIRAASKHHDPPSFRRDGVVPAAHILNVANYMAKNLNVGFEDEKYDDLAQLESARLLSLDKKTLDIIFEQCRNFYQSELSALEGA